MFAIVTDSTSTIPVFELEKMGVTPVPLTITFGTDMFVDGYELGPDQFYSKMAAFRPQGLPKSACPAPGAYEKAYRDAIAAGADGILCICLSGGVSGTYNSACVGATAAADTGKPIRVINSRSTIDILTMMIETACAMRDAGRTLDEAAERMEAIVEQSRLYIAMDTIENIFKGGKIMHGGEGAESTLSIKPILTLRKSDGAVDIVSKSRGVKGMFKDLVDLIEEYTKDQGSVEIRFCQANADDRVDDLKRRLDKKGIGYSDTPAGWICSLIGVYVGDKSVGVCMVPKSLLGA